MSEIVLPLFASVTLEKLISIDGGEPELPTLKLGDTIRSQLRTFDSSTGALIEVFPKIRALSAAIGKVIEPPTKGDFMLKRGVDGEPFGPIAINTSGAELIAVFNAAEIGVACAEVEIETDKDAKTIPGLWLVRFDTNDPITDVQVAVNKLRPESFARWRPFQIGDVWWHELRLIQAPLAMNEDPAARVLPPAPSVRRIRAGGAVDYSDPLNPIALNEIQALTVPVVGFSNPFTGTFTLRWRGRESKVLGIQDGPEQIASALNAMFSDGKARFSASTPTENEAWIEFIGPLGGAEQQLITVSVKTFKPGQLTFTLSLDRAQMHSALRSEKEIAAELEIELEVVGDDEDPSDPLVTGRLITFKHSITIVREQIWAELATIRTIDFLRPPTPRDYRGFNNSQVIVGNQATYIQAIGDGEHRSFSIPHMRGTSNGTFSLRENSAGGRYLLPDEYTLRLSTDAPDNEFILDLPEELDPPALNAFVFNFTAAGPASAFIAGLHVGIDQVDGLDEILTTFNERVSTIEEQLPSSGPPVVVGTTSAGNERTINLPNVAEIFPGKITADAASKATKLATLLPAVHVASFVVLAPDDELPDAADSAGEVLQNGTGAALRLSLPRGWKTSALRSDPVAHGGFVASDGSCWYRVVHEPETNSYYPALAERVLCAVPINDKQLRQGGRLKMAATLSLATINAQTAAEFVLVVEAGTLPEQSAPAPTGTNLEDVVWNIAAPLLAQRIVFNAVAVDHAFGVELTRNDLGVFSASYQLYGVSYATNRVPAAANFALRARLIKFDTENSAPARGYVSCEFKGGSIRITA